MTLVTRVNGSSRDPYPPTTVSLLTKPRFDFKSASTTRIGLPRCHSSRMKTTRPRSFKRAAAGDQSIASTEYGWTAGRPAGETLVILELSLNRSENADRFERRRPVPAVLDAGSRHVVLNRRVV